MDVGRLQCNSLLYIDSFISIPRVLLLLALKGQPVVDLVE